MTTLNFVWDTDESCDIFIDETYIDNINYDDGGWDGMISVIQILTSIAHLKGWGISVQGESGI